MMRTAPRIRCPHQHAEGSRTVTEHRRKVGVLNMLVGVLILLAGVSVCLDWATNDTSWQVAIKGPVWIGLGAILVMIGREFASEG
jgi:hypothetical protein